MPYISNERVELITNNPQNAKEPGDWVYLFTKEYTRMWLSNPSYATFHAISKTVERPETDRGVWELTSSLKVFVGVTDLQVARKEAVAEFRRRVMTAYETAKSSTPGHADPYKELVEELNAKADTEKVGK